MAVDRHVSSDSYLGRTNATPRDFRLRGRLVGAKDRANMTRRLDGKITICTSTAGFNGLHRQALAVRPVDEDGFRLTVGINGMPSSAIELDAGVTATGSRNAIIKGKLRSMGYIDLQRNNESRANNHADTGFYRKPVPRAYRQYAAVVSVP